MHREKSAGALERWSCFRQQQACFNECISSFGKPELPALYSAVVLGRLLPLSAVTKPRTVCTIK